MSSIRIIGAMIVVTMIAGAPSCMTVLGTKFIFYKGSIGSTITMMSMLRTMFMW